MRAATTLVGGTAVVVLAGLLAACAGPVVAPPSTPGTGRVGPTSGPGPTPATPVGTTGRTPVGTTGPTPVVTTGPTPLPAPYVAGVRWVASRGGRSLQVRPTLAGRRTGGSDAEAWAEVLRLAPDADTPGMRAQLTCHWTFARVVEPDKPTWNLEPWRPVVSGSAMVASRCNPGGGPD